MYSRIFCLPPLWLSEMVLEPAVVVHWECSVRPRTWKSSDGAVHCSWRIRADYLNPLHHSVLAHLVLAHTRGQEGQRTVVWCGCDFKLRWSFTAKERAANQKDQVRFASRWSRAWRVRETSKCSLDAALPMFSRKQQAKYTATSVQALQDPQDCSLSKELKQALL